MGHGQIKAVKVHGLGSCKGRFQVLSFYLHSDVPEVETFGGVGRLLHNAGGIAVHRIAEHAGEMGAIILFHGPCAPLSGFFSIVAQGVDSGKGDGVPVPLVGVGQQQRLPPQLLLPQVRITPIPPQKKGLQPHWLRHWLQI